MSTRKNGRRRDTGPVVPPEVQAELDAVYREIMSRAPEHDIDPASLLGSHSLAVQQLVAIARSLDVQAKVLVLDEPTSSLDADEVTELFRVIRSLKEEGVAILFVSHFLDQVYEISDRLTVFRNGKPNSAATAAVLCTYNFANTSLKSGLRSN